tara:strand:+ start:978 stop:1214 length:237 start_codon:yes stop_codon:yes gene_type:complete
MASFKKQALRLIESPDWFGATRYAYSDYLADVTDITEIDFFANNSIPFAAKDILWAKLGDGYQVFTFTSPTTVEVATG